MRFFEGKSALTECSPRASCYLEKSWRVLNLSCSLELYTSPFAAPEHISGLFCLGRTWMQSLGVFSSSLLLSGIVVWCWLSVNAFCSRVVLCWYILPNMLIFEYYSLSPESFIIEPCLFTMSFVRLVFVGTPSPCALLLRSINTLLECLFSSIEHSVETFVVMNMLVCEVEQPPSVFCSSCVSCRSWRKSYDRD